MDGISDLSKGRNLLTAVVSDHGEGLGDNAEDSHGFFLFDTTVRIPMILHHPGFRGGKVVSESVSMNDLAPTLLKLLGAEPEGMTGTDLSYLFGSGERGSPLAYFEAAHPFFSYNWSPLFGVTDGRYKLIDGPEPRLFDLSKDPGEKENIYSREKDKAESMRRIFHQLLSREAKSERIELGSEDQKRIEALGYAGSSVSSAGENPMPPGRIIDGLRDPGDGLKIWKRCTKARSLLMSQSKEDQEKAIAIIEEVLLLDPGNPTFLAHAGSIYFRTKKYDKAARVLEQSLEKLESSTTRETLASCYMNLNRNKEALEILLTNAELHPFDLVSRFKLGEALMRERRPQEAQLHLDFFLENHAARDELHGIAEKLKKRAQIMISRADQSGTTR